MEGTANTAQPRPNEAPFDKLMDGAERQIRNGRRLCRGEFYRFHNIILPPTGYNYQDCSWGMLLRRSALSQLIYLGSLVLLTAGDERPVSHTSSERDFCPRSFGSLASRCVFLNAYTLCDGKRSLGSRADFIWVHRILAREDEDVCIIGSDLRAQWHSWHSFARRPRFLFHLSHFD